MIADIIERLWNAWQVKCPSGFLRATFITIKNNNPKSNSRWDSEYISSGQIHTGGNPNLPPNQ